VVRDLGGGRMEKNSKIQPLVGVDEIAKPGERVTANAVLCRIHASSSRESEIATQRLKSAFDVGDPAGPRIPLIADIVS
jgi:thymidine phosphorylase